MASTRRTTRERRLARAERLDEWAGKREERGSAEAAEAERLRSIIPLGQPILVGHHSEGRDRRFRARLSAKEDRAQENLRTAENMRGRAATIRAQAERAIYDDDEDAIPRLEAKITALVNQRERIKRYNASCRKAAARGELGDLSLLSDEQRAEITRLARISHGVRPGGAFPAYVSSNLSGNISRLRERIRRLEAAR